MVAAVRNSPSGPLVDIIDPELVALARVMYVDLNTPVPFDDQSGSILQPFSTLARAVARLATTGGILVVAPGNYSTEAALSLGNFDWTITNIDPHPNYAIGTVSGLSVILPAITCAGNINLVGVRMQSAAALTVTTRLTVDSCWFENATSAFSIDGFDCRYLSTASMTIGGGMTLTDCELDAQTITATTNALCRLVDCLLATSFTYNCVATGTLRMDARTASAFGAITVSAPNANVIFETAATGSGQQIVNNTATGSLGVVDISLLGPGGSYVLQPAGNFNIDGFTAKQNGFYFDLIWDQAASTLLGTLNYDVGATLTSMRTPQSASLGFVRNTTIRLRYQFNRWRVQTLAINPFAVAPILQNQAASFLAYVSFAAGGGGAADDVTVVSNIAPNFGLPFNVRVVDAWLLVSTAVVGSSCQLRTALAGGGSVLSSALSSAATGTSRNNDTVTRTNTSGSPIILRRSDSGVAGEILVELIRT